MYQLSCFVFFMALTLSQTGFAMTPVDESSPRSPRSPHVNETRSATSPAQAPLEDLKPLASFFGRFGDSVIFTDEADKFDILTLAFGLAKNFKSLNNECLTGGDNIVILIDRLVKLKENRCEICRATKILIAEKMTEYNIINILSAVSDLKGDYVDKCKSIKSLVTNSIDADDICVLLLNINFWGPKYTMIAAVTQRIITPDMDLYDVRQTIQRVRALDQNLCYDALPLLTEGMDISEFEQIIESLKRLSVE